MTSTIITTLLLLLLFFFFSPVLSQSDEFSYKGFSTTTNSTTTTAAAASTISLNGISQIDSTTGILRLTNDTSRLIGRAFYPTPLRLKNATSGRAFSFSTAFAFGIVPEYPKLGGHGMAFTIAPNPDLKGGLPSQYLGILNSSDVGNFSNHIFFVEFDTVQDFEFGDINDNHVGVNLNDMRSNASQAAAYYDAKGNKNDLNLKSGKTVQAWIDYDGEKGLLNVTLSPFSYKPSTPLVSFPLDLSPVLEDTMFVGFSSSTGLLASSHYLFGWNFKMNGEVKSLDLSTLPSLPKSKKKNVSLIFGVSVSALLLLFIAAVLGGYMYYKIKTADVIEPWEVQYGPHRFSYKELKRATRGFRDRELLGSGGFGKVYKGTLPVSKVDVAVKRVAHGSKQGLREFVNEIASIGRLRHRNLVQLQGWCRRRADLLLVYDYMPNGSVDKYLFGDDDGKRSTLSWIQRFRILRGVASALLYLHEEWEHVVIHRDVKASNVLLDGDMNGRLGDFGLAKLYEHGANPSTTRVVGTLGYLAPELTRTGRATTSTDVFAFGAMMLEVVCGRRPIEPKAVPEELILVDWVWEKWTTGKAVEVVDPRLNGEFIWEEVEVVVKVGLMCSHPDARGRPTMREVVMYLDGDAEVPEVMTPPEECDGRSPIGFEDYLHSYPSSSFEKTSNKGTAVLVTGGDGGGKSKKLGSYSPLSILSQP